MKRKTLCVVSGLLAPVMSFWTMSPRVATAGGFDLPDQDAFAIGRGMAFVATADNPSAIYYNPAGLTQLSGNTIRGGLYGLYFGPTYESPAGGSYDNEANWHALPQLYYAGRAESLPLGYGIGFFAPFGLSSEWPQDTGFRTLGTEASLTYLAINPAVAYEVLPGLSLGAGITFNYAEADLRQGLVWPAQSFDEFKFEGNGWAVGYNLGLLWRAHEKLYLGVSFRSSTTVDMDGSTTARNSVPFPPPPSPAFLPPFAVTQDARADLAAPLKAIFGISFRPTPAWNIEFNADYTDWSKLDTITVKQAAAIPGVLPQDVNLVLNWEASWYYEFGVTRYLDNGWSVSAGYILNENSVPDANYTPVVADLTRHFLSLGLGHRGERFDFDVAYQFGYGPDHRVEGSAPSVTGQTADGTYDFVSHALAVSVSWHF